MNDLPPHIRNASHADAAEIAALLHQLGYESTPDQVAERMSSIQRSSTDLVLVATSEEHVIACVSLHVMPMLHAAGFLGRITSLVVDAGCRGQGIGRALMGAAQEWFAANGCVKMEVNSGNLGKLGEPAHQFYETLGLARDGQRFSRLMQGNDAAVAGGVAKAETAAA